MRHRRKGVKPCVLESAPVKLSRQIWSPQVGGISQIGRLPQSTWRCGTTLFRPPRSES